MTDFELTLVAALRAEAEEIAMSIDSYRAADELENRLDRVDHGRRRVYWVAAAVVLLVVTGAVFLASRPGTEAESTLPGQDTAVPTAGTSYTSEGFGVPFTMTLPPWVSEQAANNPESAPTEIVWDADACTATVQTSCSRWDEGVRITSPQAIYRPGSEGPQPVPAYEDYVAFLGSLSSTAGLEINDMRSMEVDGREATVMTLMPTRNIEDARFSCTHADSGPDDCWFPTPGRQLRLAAIDTGATPLVIWMVGDPDEDARWAELTEDFDATLASLRFDLTAISPAP